MSLEELRKKRLKWVEANRENGFEDGIKHLLADLYPDNAHFIYELLQNAEDAKATEVRFILKEDGVEFEHNGRRLFSDEDVEAITSIGISTKKDDPTNIGKFGVGFKAVFAYTETPEVASGEFHFRIRDLVVPDTYGLPCCELSEKETRFSFPFDNPQKSPQKACEEVEKNLRQLDEGTLLFVANIRKIEYLLPDSPPGFLERRETNGNQIEIVVQHPEDSKPASVFFLRFEKTVNVNDEDDKPKPCRIAVAFGLRNHQEQQASLTPTKWRVAPLTGKVSIYFPADKETSNLRFHLHAPFASTVARDSVRDCEANDALRDHLADLVSESMTAIRDQNLLTVSFLATLPNDKDNLPGFYRPIMNRLIKAFKEEKLTPMKQGDHAAANRIFRGSAQLSNLITDDDLATILGEGAPPMWIANPPQRHQRADNFLSMLNIAEWTTKDLVNELYNKSESIMNWLEKKADEGEWHQRLYLLCYPMLDDFLMKYKLLKLRIVPCSDGIYRVGSECYFPSDDVEHDEDFPRVAKCVYSSAANESQQEKVREFLGKIGVREVGEAEQVEVILKQRYSQGSIKPREQDMKRFIELVEKERGKTSLFSEYFIFQLENGEWGKPGIVFLDTPYLDTGLKVYYKAFGEGSGRKRALSPKYQESGIEMEKLKTFAKSVGVQTRLEVVETSTYENPNWEHLVKVGGERSTSPIDRDYMIPKLEELLKTPDEKLSKLVWRTMRELPNCYLTATYQRNWSHGSRTSHSQLVHHLRNAAWIPQKEDESVSFVKPRDASIECLPKGFPYEAGQPWLEKIEFGKNRRDREEQERLEKEQATQEYQQQAEREQIAVESLGTDKEGFERAKEFSALPPDEQKRLLDESKQRSSCKFPEREPTNSERRGERVAEQAKDAPERIFENRSRSVSVEREAVKSETEPYLRTLYTRDDELFCQICHRPMPFKLSDGKHYFEMVEFLELNKRHYQNYLALCPNHAAMYRHANESKNSVLDSFKNLEPERLEMALTLAEQGVAIEFTKTHIKDLKVVIDVEKSSQQHDT